MNKLTARASASVSGFMLAAMLVAACGGAASPSAGAASAVPSSPSSAPSASPSGGPPSGSASAALPSTGLPSFDVHGATDLEAMLPAMVCGAPAQKYSFNGDLFITGASSTDPTLVAVLQQLGKSPSDVNFAVASVVDPSCKTTMLAFRIKGVDQGQFEQIYVASTSAQGSAASKVSVGGKDVWKSKSASGNGFTYAYFNGDTLLGVEAETDEKAAAALSTMP